MRLFGIGTATKEALVVVDTDGGAIGLGIALSESKGIRIVQAKRIRLPIETRSEEQAAIALSEVLKEHLPPLITAYAASDHFAEGGPPKRVSVLLHAPWVQSETFVIEQQFEKPEQITAAAIREAGAAALSKQAVAQGDIIESGIVRVEVNGYSTHHAAGKKGSSFGITILRSTCNARLKQLFDGVIGVILSQPPQYVSMARAATTFIRQHGLRRRSYLLVDIGADGSLFATIKRDAITHHETLPVGVNTILKRLSGEKGLPDDILSLMRMVAGESCTDEACVALAQSLSAVEPELLKSYGEVLTKLAEKRRLPNSLVLFAPRDVALWLAHFFSRLDFSQFTTTMRPFSVEIFDSIQLPNVVQFDPGIERDNALALGAALFNNSFAVK